MLLIAGSTGPAAAQDRVSPYGVSPSVLAPSGGTTYLPYGGTSGGGFVPYAPGPGGGLGVMVRPRASAVGATGGMGGMGGAAPAIAPRGRPGLTPLAPLGRLGLGLGSGGRAGAMRGPAMPGPRLGRAGGRSPVGSYPFRPPTNFAGPASAGPAMSM